MVRRLAQGVAALLVLFHAWVFAGQASAGRFDDPTVLLRWLVAAALVAGLVAIRRSGASVLWGRQAVAVWVLAALLHGPVIAERAATTIPAVPKAIVTLVVQLANASMAVGLGVLVALAARRRAESLRPLLCGPGHAGVLRLFRTGFLVSFAPRPPPLA